ncbi:protein NUCLEAR FUSION DEFECTIVE 4-like [Senna tora]|uniref:Protein NUCLEAR FUSION DEFECTIVE 4-like n=1 Tax=Senna tora TaxID=362788 RepID=A0A834WK57_9FABA|nr:protein NUCLEAR FUSION DEFECTIVE 4-like [Senna tora]
MIGESRKWMILVATIWVQAFTGTNFDFSSYSSDLKSVLKITQLQLNYLSVASDLGKAFGWCSGLSLLFFPYWLVLIISAFLGLLGYGLQWLVFVSCLIAGCSICWFNTVCYVLCIRNFPPQTRSLALSLGVAFNGVSAAIYTLLVNAINSSDDTLYLFLNALVPLLISSLSLISIISISKQPHHQPSSSSSSSSSHHHHVDSPPRHTLIFLCFYFLSLITGLYLLILNYLSSSSSTSARVILVGAVLLLVLPFFLPGFVYSHEWTSRVIPLSSSFCLYDDGGGGGEEVELRKELIGDNGEGSVRRNNGEMMMSEGGCLGKVIERNQIRVIGEEHTVKMMVCKWDFWLYYFAYFCGGTVGLVYSNNLGQISQSLGFNSQTSSLVTLYSTCSFFGRLLSAAPDFLRKTGWFAIALVPTPIAFLLLCLSDSGASLSISTGLIGLSSGFVFASAISITSELFGAKSAGVNHNILITNIPVGSLLYGLLAALIYDSNAESWSSSQISWLSEMLMCMGRKCYLQTFIWWGCISMVGLGSSFLLFLRTRMAYDSFARNRSIIEQ